MADRGMRRTGDESQKAAHEGGQVLGNWSFFVSAAGLIYARPMTNVLMPWQLAVFLRRVRHICEDKFPGVIMLDFSRIEIEASGWGRHEAILDLFAQSIGATHVSRPYGAAGKGYSLIYRPQCLGHTVPGFCLPFDDVNEASGRRSLEAIAAAYAELMEQVCKGQSRLMGGEPGRDGMRRWNRFDL
jgi:hypothetical protein